MDKTLENKAPNTSSIAYDLHSKIRKQDHSSRKYNLLRIKFVTPTFLSSWRKTPKSSLIQSIREQTHIADLFKLLFAISEDLQWRQWSLHIQTLIQQIHNLLLKEKEVQIYSSIIGFQHKLERLFCMKDKHILAHLLLLAELLITLNKSETILDQSSFSISILDLVGEPEVNTKIMWMLCSMRQVNPQCIGKIIRKELFNQNQLPFLTIISNFATYATEQCIIQLLENGPVSAFLSQVYTLQFVNYSTKREAQLFFNNVLGRRAEGFYKIVSNSNLLQALLSQISEQTWWTIYILRQASKHTQNVYLTEENSEAIINSLEAAGIFNNIIKQQLTIGNQVQKMHKIN